MILSDREIEAAIANGFIKVHPVPDRRLWTSTAIDLTLHEVLMEWDPKPLPSGEPFRVRPNGPNFNVRELMDDPAHAKKFRSRPTGTI